MQTDLVGQKKNEEPEVRYVNLPEVPSFSIFSWLREDGKKGVRLSYSRTFYSLQPSPSSPSPHSSQSKDNGRTFLIFSFYVSKGQIYELQPRIEQFCRFYANLKLVNQLTVTVQLDPRICLHLKEDVTEVILDGTSCILRYEEFKVFLEWLIYLSRIE